MAKPGRKAGGKALSAIIVGAGIGGLSAALALARRGIVCTVLERADSLGEVGAGIQLSPNATRVLHAFSLSDALNRVAFRPEAVEARGWRSGRMINRAPLGSFAEEQFGAPYLHIHRADLVSVLAEAVAAEPLVSLRLGQAGMTCATDGTAAVMTGDGQTLSADLLIGADGIHSLVREMLFGAQEPRFTGNVAWRGVIPAALVAEAGIAPVAGLWMGPGAHFVHYFVRRGELLNFVGIVETADWQDESWSARGSKAQLLRDFGHWHPAVRSIVSAAPEDGCFRWALFDRAPLPHWSKGNASLLGDACHPTLPFMAQGACMAIEDAAVLAGCLTGADAVQVPQRLLRYEALRKDRTAAIQAGSRRNAQMYHLRPPLSWLRNRAMQKGSGLSAQMRDLYGYDALVAPQTT